MHTIHRNLLVVPLWLMPFSCSGNPSDGGTSVIGGQSSIGTGGATAVSSGGLVNSSGGSTAVGTVNHTGGTACGPCPGIACFGGVQITVTPATNASTAIISDLLVTSPDITSISCDASSSPCQWTCRSQSVVPDGDHTISISAPGYQSVTLQFQTSTPTNCGCCGCCASGYFQQVQLEPTGTAVTGCCANLNNDPYNCGSCGYGCLPGASCSSGKCGFARGNCVINNGAYSTCDAYCASVGRQCSSTCTPLGAAAVWTGNSCSGASTMRGCADSLQTASAYSCCCGG